MTQIPQKPEGKLIKPANPFIYVALTAYRDIEQKTVQSLFNSIGGLPYQFGLATHTSANVWKGRNHLAEVFLDSQADYILFVDADMVFTPQHMDTLIKAALDNPEAGIMGGFYVSRDENLRPLVSWTDSKGFQLPAEDCIKRLLENRGQIVEADLIPTGFMLIKREVFEKLENPWFHVKTVIGDDGEIHHYSSDNVFVQKVQDAGFKTMAHLGVELGHVGNFVYHPAQMWPQLEAWSAMDQLQKAKAQYGEQFGYNSKEYWDALYATEGQLGRVRQYPVLHKAIVAGVQPDWNVADIGSGPGVLGQQIAAVAKHVDCFDLSSYAVAQCEKQGLSALQYDLVNDAVPTGYHGAYDCVVCTEVLEHLEDPQAAIKKLYSFLKPEGLLMISVPDDRLPPEEEPEHVGTFTAAKLAKLLQPFTDVFVEPINGYLLGVGIKPPKDK